MKTQLHSLSSSLVSDILDDFRVRSVIPGVFPIDRKATVVGMAMPVQMRSKANAAIGLRQGLMRAVDAAPKGSILVISSDTRLCSTWGGVTASYAKISGIRGVVVYGAIRDSCEIIKLRLPVFASSITPISGYNRLEVASFGKPVKCGSVTVRKGDLVVADRDGVAIVQARMSQEVLNSAARLQTKEKQEIIGITKRLRQLQQPTRSSSRK